MAEESDIKFFLIQKLQLFTTTLGGPIQNSDT